MGDTYWNRRGPIRPSASGRHYELAPSPVSSGHETSNYIAPDDDRGGSRMVRNAQTLGSAYDRYLQSLKAVVTTGGLRATGGGMPALPICDPVATDRLGVSVPELAPTGRRMAFSGQFQGDGMTRSCETLLLPPDASSTLYVEGIPLDSTKREVAYFFHPFFGYKEVRLVAKEFKHSGDPFLHCFVDFLTPACAAMALNTLQGDQLFLYSSDFLIATGEHCLYQEMKYVYANKMDELDPHSANLHLQFSKFPGPRSGRESHAKR